MAKQIRQKVMYYAREDATSVSVYHLGDDNYLLEVKPRAGGLCTSKTYGTHAEASHAFRLECATLK